MNREIDFQQAIDKARNLEEDSREKFYEQFPEIVQQEKIYDIMAVQQHSFDEGFAKDLEGRNFNRRDIDKDTQNSLKSQLTRLSNTAAGEAAALQNITVYDDTIEIWERSETPEDLLTYLENYAELRSEWEEREDLIADKQPGVQYGSQDQEYIEEILSKLVTETFKEI